MMSGAESHFLPVLLDAGQGTQAFWSQDPDGDLVVFVHGFGGRAVDTWVGFQYKVALEPEFAHKDVVFYGYDGLHARAAVSSAGLRDFLGAIFADPCRVINRTLPDQFGRAGFAFKRLVLVTHSLGAVIGRLALLDGVVTTEPWAQNAVLACFAPAHLGARLVALLASWNPLANLIAYARPPLHLFKLFTVLLDLDMDSKTLEDLKERTAKAYSLGAANVMAKAVFHANDDRVVEIRAFLSDHPMRVFTRTNHSDICKPTLLFPDPWESLKEVLR